MTTRTKSVSKKREDRREHDAYESPVDLCVEICSFFARRQQAHGGMLFAPKTVLEPGAGTGNFVRAVKAQWPAAFVDAVEIRDVKPSGDAFTRADLLTVKINANHYDLIIGNPPYGGGLAEAFVRKCIPLLAPNGVLAFLLKMHFFGTRKRQELWGSFPFTAAYPIIPRPDFTGDGRDTSEYALICWERGDSGALTGYQTVYASQPIVWKQAPRRLARAS
jgi:hypothetical protein